MSPGSAVITTLLTPAATFLVLSLFVQTVQEMLQVPHQQSHFILYEDTPLTSSVHRRTSCGDQAFFPDLAAQGPFQFKRLRRRGVLMSLPKDGLVERLGRTSLGWYQLAPECDLIELLG